MAAAENPKGEQAQYAKRLLEEVLNRAAVLEEGAYWLAFERHMQAEEPKLDDPEYALALENLMGALRIFLDDCEEARVRARRARLVCRDPVVGMLVTSESVESDESLEPLGGPLVPAWWETGAPDAGPLAEDLASTALPAPVRSA